MATDCVIQAEPGQVVFNPGPNCVGASKPMMFGLLNYTVVVESTQSGANIYISNRLAATVTYSFTQDAIAIAQPGFTAFSVSKAPQYLVMIRTNLDDNNVMAVTVLFDLLLGVIEVIYDIPKKLVFVI